MKKYQKNALQKIDFAMQVGDKMFKSLTLNLKEHDAERLDVIKQLIFLIFEDIKDVIYGNTPQRIITERPRFSELMTAIDLAEQDLIPLTLDILRADIKGITETIEQQKYIEMNQIKMFVAYGLTPNKFMEIIKYTPEEELDYLPPQIKNEILKIREKQIFYEEIKDKYFKLRDNYFKKIENLTLENVLKATKALEEIGIQGELLFLLTCKMLEEVKIPTETQTKKESKKENVPPSPTNKKTIIEKKYTLGEQERRNEIQEIKNNYYDITKDKPIRSLSLFEKANLIIKLENLGYSENEVRNIIQKIDKAYPKKEQFANLDLLEKIELAKILKINFYSDDKIKNVLNQIHTGMIRNHKELTEEQKIMRTAIIYKVFLSSIQDQDAYQEIKEVLQESHENEEEKESWKNYARELIQEAYNQNDHNCEIEEAKRRMKQK